MNKKTNIFQNICIYILSFFIILSLIFLVMITPNDELWNFQNTYKMFNGFKIYTDANVIITPIFFNISNILLHIFSSNFLIFRIYNILIYICLFFIIYKILKNLNTCKNLHIFYIVLSFLLMFQVIVAGANYNALAIFFVLIGINLYVSNKSNNILQGLLIFLTFFTKQNIGIFYAISILIYELYINKFTKKYVLNQIKKFLVFVIFSTILILKLYLDKNLFDFINYCFGGLFEFGKKNVTLTATPYYFLIPLTTIALYTFTIFKKATIFKEFSNVFFKNLTLLFIFALFNTLLAYPIINSAHLIYTFPFHLIFIFYYFDTLILKELFDTEKYKINIKWFSIAILLILFARITVYFLADYDTLVYCSNSSSPYFNTFMIEENYNKIISLKEYIKEKNSNNIDVIIVSYDSALSMIELKQSHGVYDLVFNGNLGYNGKDRIKQDILAHENTEFLVVTNEDDLFVQEPPEIRQFIIDNLNFRGTICNYSIYGK